VYHTSRRKAYINSHQTEGKRQLKQTCNSSEKPSGQEGLSKREKMFAGNI
jgi:hypothetical protein